ncbi:putative protein [Aquifex aeolicus VF5]|uniref:Mce/MlaD domain-containing protein n=1 Tax=Aquifex aeolicus (strain VF5) TaxID=224324 RepID=O67491_AQUAE|nr:putative protein [Aquifex aeolicus VF5]
MHTVIEGRVNYILVGLFILLGLGVTLFVLFLMTDIMEREKFRPYLIYTTQSVEGLNTGAAVYYKGVQVGKVKEIKIAKNQELIKIKVLIDKDFKVRDGLVATLGVQGITGLAYINLEYKEGYKLGRDPEENLPVIPMEPSELQKLTQSLPELLSKTDELLTNLGKFFSEENAEEISKVLKNTNKTLKSFEELSGKLENISLRVEKLVANADKKLGELEVKKLNEVLEEYKNLAVEVEKFVKNLSNLSEKVDRETLRKFEELINSLEKTSEEVQKLVRKLKNNPSQMLEIKTIKPHEVEEW